MFTCNCKNCGSSSFGFVFQSRREEMLQRACLLCIVKCGIYDTQFRQTCPDIRQNSKTQASSVPDVEASKSLAAATMFSGCSVSLSLPFFDRF
jgi:hypothetical protein